MSLKLFESFAKFNFADVAESTQDGPRGASTVGGGGAALGVFTRTCVVYPTSSRTDDASSRISTGTAPRLFRRQSEQFARRTDPRSVSTSIAGCRDHHACTASTEFKDTDAHLAADSTHS